jgi:hypothetical protein
MIQSYLILSGALDPSNKVKSFGQNTALCKDNLVKLEYQWAIQAHFLVNL